MMFLRYGQINYDNPGLMEVLKMLLFIKYMRKAGVLVPRLIFLLMLFPAMAMLCGSAFAAGAKHKTQKTGSQKTFSSPETAVEALVLAAKSNDTQQLLAIFGPEGKQLVSSGDEVEDRAGLERFVQAYNEKNRVVPEGGKKAVLEVGNEAWPLPIPILKAAGGEWYFDTKQGKEEILNRRIGRNELSTIQVCLAYVDAQREYASKDRDGDGLLKYSQKFLSDPGTKNGLYWEAKSDEEQSPLGPMVGNAMREGYTRKGGQPVPYHGYFFKILKSQGKDAPRGAYDYVVNGKMIGGFAMVAYPAQYGTSGIMTFIVSHDGVVYEKNLGKNTASAAQVMTSFNPDQTWRRVKGKHIEPPESSGGV